MVVEELAHGVGEEVDGDFHGYDLALGDVGLDHLAVLTALAELFGAKKIAGREMGEAIVSDEVGRLCALTTARTAEEEDDGDFFRGEAGGGGSGGGGGRSHCERDRGGDRGEERGGLEKFMEEE